ncbi:hypothetical protein ANANG_G00302830, partial [Anguilla anguilla]
QPGARGHHRSPRRGAAGGRNFPSLLFVLRIFLFNENDSGVVMVTWEHAVKPVPSREGAVRFEAFCLSDGAPPPDALPERD